jgi:hypothetical protein
MNINDLIKNLQSGIVEVTFEKINNGGTRIMPCTLNSDIISEETGSRIEVNSVDPSSDHVAVWGCDVRNWRSFRVSTVTGWKPLPDFTMGEHHEATL